MEKIGQENRQSVRLMLVIRNRGQSDEEVRDAMARYMFTGNDTDYRSVALWAKTTIIIEASPEAEQKAKDLIRELEEGDSLAIVRLGKFRRIRIPFFSRRKIVISCSIDGLMVVITRRGKELEVKHSELKL